MDNKIVSTTYAPLQPPYQIIKYCDDVAMQIGTLIVTLQKEGTPNGPGYQIETHSHPVVAYENKDSYTITDIHGSRSTQHLANHLFMEGAVWDAVEIKDVTTVCLSNALLSWDKFIDFLNRDVDRRFEIDAAPSIGLYWPLKHFGIDLKKPYSLDLHLIHLETRKPQHPDCPPMVRARMGDIFCLNARADDEEMMIDELTAQLTNYRMILMDGKNETHRNFIVSYFATEKKYRQLAEALNSDEQFTRFPYWTN